jgi:hypothetical protein
MRGSRKLKEETIDRTLWRTRFGGGYGHVVRGTTGGRICGLMGHRLIYLGYVVATLGKKSLLRSSWHKSLLVFFVINRKTVFSTIFDVTIKRNQ